MAESTATVRSRAESITNARLVGRTVAQVRQEFCSIINIADNAIPQVNGEEVGESTRLNSGDVLVFSVPTGSKG